VIVESVKIDDNDKNPISNLQTSLERDRGLFCPAADFGFSLTTKFIELERMSGNEQIKSVVFENMTKLKGIEKEEVCRNMFEVCQDSCILVEQLGEECFVRCR
jgi:hypothetical protein